MTGAYTPAVKDVGGERGTWAQFTTSSHMPSPSPAAAQPFPLA